MLACLLKLKGKKSVNQCQIKIQASIIIFQYFFLRFSRRKPKLLSNFSVFHSYLYKLFILSSKLKAIQVLSSRRFRALTPTDAEMLKL